MTSLSSAESPLLRGLAPSQQQRLAAVLEEYLTSLEEGLAPSPAALIARHPDLAEPLKAQLESLCLLQQAAWELRPEEDRADDQTVFSQQRLGDYELVREIGRGGMGVVYEAIQISLDRRVAMKILPFAALLDDRQIERFKNEARLAAQLHHPTSSLSLL